LTKYIWAED